MIGKVISVDDEYVKVKLSINIYDYNNLIGKNVVFEGKNKIIGEVSTADNECMLISLIGELINNDFVYGDINKPGFKDIVRIINKDELDLMFANDHSGNSICIGKSYVYDNYPINLNVNQFFSNHFAILGNTGSGKSCAIANIIQNVFKDPNKLPLNANIFMFDAYGEYQQAFNNIHDVNENVNYKVYTTNLLETSVEHIKIPFWLLSVDDIALLLKVDSPSNLPILEKALKLVVYFVKNESDVVRQKNDIIARCLLDIINSGGKASDIRNKVVSTLTKFYTINLNLQTNLTKGGWTRTLSQCMYVEANGNFSDVQIVIEYLESLTGADFELSYPDGSYMYSIEDFAQALDFALISEGILQSDRVFAQSNVLKVRLNALINSDYVNYFRFDNYVNRETYISWLLTTSTGTKAQVINFNINYVDDRFGKSLVKIYSKLLFDYIVTLKDRASFPFHIVLEEAHRYVQNDSDVDVLGYNIFERITKEGRKYGILLGLISQRPSEISETALSQCSNFLVFKIFHPRDLTFISDVIPNVSTSMIEKFKTLHPGTCVIFGNAFKLPVLVSLTKPNPEPLSSSCNIDHTWYLNS